MEFVYVVIVKGMYRHEYVGAFSDLDCAVAQASNYAMCSNDDYHEYQVSKLYMDSPLPNEHDRSSDLVCTVIRKDVKGEINLTVVWEG